MELIAKTFEGLEQILATELIEMGANDIQIGNRMVAFSGDKAMLYRTNFALHTALRILVPIKHFEASDPDTVYDEVKKIDWSQYMTVKNTFAIDHTIFSSEFRHSQFVAYRMKDAIVDYWRERTDGERPNVRITNPELRINIHIAEKDVTISLDSSGESLHRRGYRQEAVEAPLNEVLAAGIIKMTGWKYDCDLIDPMCGSGTLPIEAALWAKNMAPGIFRQDYAFMHWPDFDEELWQSIYDDDSNEREFNHHIYGYDINHNAVKIACDNVKAAGVRDIVTVEQGDFADYKNTSKDTVVVVMNPPYGKRITSDDLLGLYATIGRKFKEEFAGSTAFVICNNIDCFDKIGLKPSFKVTLYNGSIECELRKYQMFSGKYNDMRAKGGRVKTAAEKAQNQRRKGGLRHSEDEEQQPRPSFRNDRRERSGERSFERRGERSFERRGERNFERRERREDYRGERRGERSFERRGERRDGFNRERRDGFNRKPKF